MINKLAKGKRVERRAEQRLQKEGYITYKPIWNRFSGKDIFGWVDVLGINKDKWRLLQIKSRKPGKEVFELIENFIVPPNTSKELWVWKGSNNFDIYILINKEETILPKI